MLGVIDVGEHVSKALLEDVRRFGSWLTCSCTSVAGVYSWCLVSDGKSSADLKFAVFG